MDIARWFLGVDHLSPQVFSVGGRLGYEDDGETANTQFIVHSYADAPLIFEVRGLPARAGDPKWTIFAAPAWEWWFDCERGYVSNPSYTEATAFDPNGKLIKKFAGNITHYENFIKAVRSRKVSDLNADIQEGYLSSSLCHTGNISYRLGQKLRLMKSAKRSNPTKKPPKPLGGWREHLAANSVDLAKTKATLGVFLKMNPKTEQFTNNKQANEMLTREYRQPFVVPEKV